MRYSAQLENTNWGEIAYLKSGFAFKSDWWTNRGIPVIKIANIDNVLNMENCSFVDENKIDMAKEFIGNAGDIVVAMTGATLGKFCIIPKHEGLYLINQRVGKVFSNIVDKDIADILPFIYCTLMLEDVKEKLISSGSGSAQPNISGNDFNNLEIKYSKQMFDAFNKKYKNLFIKLQNNYYEIEKLNNLKQLYLKKFFG